MRPIPCCLLPRVSHLSSLSWHSRLLKQRRIPERTLLTAAARTLNVLNVSSSSRDLGLAALCFLRAAFFSARFPRRFFRANPPPFTQFQVFSTQVLAFVLPTCWVKHSQHASTSPSSTLCLLACALRASLLSSLRVPRFPRRRCTNFAAAGNDFTLLGCIATNRQCC